MDQTNALMMVTAKVLEPVPSMDGAREKVDAH